MFSFYYQCTEIQEISALILYPENIANSLINSFLVASLVFSMRNIMSFAKSDHFTSFHFWITFISSFALIAMVRTSKTVLNYSVAQEWTSLL